MRTRNKRPFTAERLMELLTYDPETGLFTWNASRPGVPYDGAPAGSITAAGYTQISIDNRSYRAHRVAWFWMTGEWPKKQIDHRNRIRSDNRWDNLRPADQTGNNANIAIRSDNKSGFKGVMLDTSRRPWLAQLRVNGQNIYIGHFPTAEEAARAYDEAAVRYFGEYALTNARLRDDLKEVA